MSEDNMDVGNVQIHQTVLEEIVHSAIAGIDGISLGRKGFWNKMGYVLSGKKYPGIRVRLKNTNEVDVSILMQVRYGLNIPGVARQVQDSVKKSLERTTEVNVTDVHVSIHGVGREV